MASPYRGVVTFGGLPLPGATITATHEMKTYTAVSDQAGAFAFDDLADGKWSLDIAMQCFTPIHTEVAVAPNMSAASWELKLLPAEQIAAGSQPVTLMPEALADPTEPKAKAAGAKPAQANAPQKSPPDQNDQSAGGFLMQGSVNNAAHVGLLNEPGIRQYTLRRQGSLHGAVSRSSWITRRSTRSLTR